MCSLDLTGTGEKVGGRLVVPQRDSVSAADRPKSGTASEQLLCQCPAAAEMLMRHLASPKVCLL